MATPQCWKISWKSHSDLAFPCQEDNVIIPNSPFPLHGPRHSLLSGSHSSWKRHMGRAELYIFRPVGNSKSCFGHSAISAMEGMSLLSRKITLSCKHQLLTPSRLLLPQKPLQLSFLSFESSVSPSLNTIPIKEMPYPPLLCLKIISQVNPRSWHHFCYLLIHLLSLVIKRHSMGL